MTSSTSQALAPVGSHITLPNGRNAIVARATVTGTPAYVRNEIRYQASRGALLRKEQGITYTRSQRGVTATCTLIVLDDGQHHIPTRPPVLRRVCTIAGGLVGTFGMSMIVGAVTADAFAQMLKYIAGGVGACVVAGLLLWAAATVTTIKEGGGGHHCPGCPDH